MSVHTLSDAALVARARSGDPTAFEELVSRHHAMLLHTARAIVRSSEDAEDVTQNAWIRAYTHLTTFSGTSSLRTWLVAITRNAAIDHRRVAIRHRQWRATQDDALALESHHRSDGPSPEEVLLKKELHAQVRRSTAALPPRLRMPLRLWRSARYSYADMAGKTGLPVGTLKSRIWEARRQVVILCQRMGHKAGHH